MDSDTFAQLEQRIGQAVDRIRNLTEERARLSAQQEELEARLAELTSHNAKLQVEVQELQEANGKRDDFEATRQEIERRVEGLLERFAELDEIAGE